MRTPSVLPNRPLFGVAQKKKLPYIGAENGQIDELVVRRIRVVDENGDTLSVIGQHPEHKGGYMRLNNANAEPRLELATDPARDMAYLRGYTGLNYYDAGGYRAGFKLAT